MYPDLKTVLVGEFVDSLDEETRMVSAKEGSISAYKCQNGILDIKVKLKYNSPNFKYDPPKINKIAVKGKKKVINTKGENKTTRVVKVSERPQKEDPFAKKNAKKDAQQ